MDVLICVISYTNLPPHTYYVAYMTTLRVN